MGHINNYSVQRTETTAISESAFLPATTTVPAIYYTSYLTLNFATANPQRPVTTIRPSPRTSTSNEDCCFSCFYAKTAYTGATIPKLDVKSFSGRQK